MSIRKISIGKNLKISDISLVINGAVSIHIGNDIKSNIIRSNKYVRSVSKKEVIYGINTGFGPMVLTYINKNKQNELQYNLVHSHAVGMGKPLESHLVRAMMLVRLHTLSRGYSGVTFSVLEGLKNFIEKDITPVVFEHGSVGASGDLVQLAHIALALIGEGEVFVRGKRMKTSTALKKFNLKKIKLSDRDGLALINGTTAMTSIAAVNSINAKQLLNLSLTSSALLMEIAEANTESINTLVSKVRPHKGQEQVAESIRLLLNGSKMVHPKSRRTLPDSSSNATDSLNETLQEIYSLRCIPQVIGPILDTLIYADGVIETEMNSVTDNPIIYPNKGIFHAGNFHGDYVALEMDKVRIAIAKLSILFERQINFLVNPRLNGKLPPFVNAGRVGLDLGLQGLQFVATSNTAENQTLSMPMSIHSISTNNDNQDIVSIGTNSAILTSKVIENTYQVEAILFAVLFQAVDFLNISKKLGSRTRKIHSDARKIFPFLKKDTALYGKIAELTDFIKNVDVTAS